MSEHPLRVTMAQVEHVGWKGEEQLSAARACLARIAPGTTDLIVLPELCPGHIEPLAEDARRLGAHLIAGGVRRAPQGGYYNRCLVFGPDGEPVGEYIKTFLDDDERKAGFVAGGRPTLFTIRGHRVGLAICGDVGLGAELLLVLASMGAEIVVVPACVRMNALGYWALHMTAKVLDTGLVIVMANYGGQFHDVGGAFGGGGSMVAVPLPHDHPGLTIDELLKRASADPASHLLAQLGPGPDYQTVLLHLDDFRRFREHLRQHRKLGAALVREMPA